MADLSPDVIEELLELVERRHDALIRNILPDLHPSEIARMLDALDADARAYLFGLLKPEVASEVLLELDELHREKLLDEMAPKEITRIVKHLDSDDAADLVGELEEPVKTEVLGRLDREEADTLRTLLAYDEDSAGGIMASEFVGISPAAGVDDAIQMIRENAEKMEDIYTIYAVDDEGKLRGVVSLRALLLARRGARLESIMEEPELTVPPEMDQEDVALRVRQYDLVEVPVVDGEGRMLGVITVDDVVDVLEEEADEDLARMTGTGDESVVTDSVLHASRHRLPWLLVGLGGGILAAYFLSRFELSLDLREFISLAFFVPVIMAMGGNVAIQSSSIAVRSLALGESAYRVMGRRILKEFLVSLLNGLVCGGVLAIVAGFWLNARWLALLIGVALFAVILISTTVGAFVPVILHRMRIDPALATGPFVTTSNDVLGIVVYLSLARWLLPIVR